MSGRPAFWFPAKRYGWGWGPPIAWQGWLVLAGWIAIFFGGMLRLVPEGPAVTLTFTLVMVAVLTAICWVKGEQPRWRWGEREK